MSSEPYTAQHQHQPQQQQLPDPQQQPFTMSQPQPDTAAKTNFAYLMTPEEQMAHSFSQEQHQQQHGAGEEKQHSKLAPMHGLQSPPTSPATHSLPNIASATGFAAASPPSPQYTAQNNYLTGYGLPSTSASPPAHPTPRFGDAALFPAEADGRVQQPQSPLFSQEQQQQHQQQQQVQQQRQSTTSPPRRRSSSPPPLTFTPRGARFTLRYPSNLDIRTPKQAEDYWLSCCADAHKMRRLPVPHSSVSSLQATRDPLSVSQLRSIERSHGSGSRVRSSTVARSNKVTKGTASGAERRHTRRVSRQQRTVGATYEASSPLAVATPMPRQQHATAPLPVTYATTTTPSRPSPRMPTSPPAAASAASSKVAKHRRAPASKPRPVGELWSDVPDFCPPLSSLATAPKPLKARPVGSSGPLDLSNDPDRGHLHPEELVVASVLRLQCAKYLLNKRKIFKGKVEHLRAAAAAAAGAGNGNGNGGIGIGRAGSPAEHGAAQAGAGGNFNKTEAQKACTIDVNKASSLFQAFEEVGWLRREWFEKFL